MGMIYDILLNMTMRLIGADTDVGKLGITLDGQCFGVSSLTSWERPMKQSWPECSNTTACYHEHWLKIRIRS